MSEESLHSAPWKDFPLSFGIGKVGDVSVSNMKSLILVALTFMLVMSVASSPSQFGLFKVKSKSGQVQPEFFYIDRSVSWPVDEASKVIYNLAMFIISGS